jgi:hypothetical protein
MTVARKTWPALRSCAVRTSLVTLPRALRSGLSISRDGRRFLFVHVDEAGSDLVLVEDFR